MVPSAYGRSGHRPRRRAAAALTLVTLQGADLERAVAATLQARGWFVLRNARDPREQAFELDVLAYRLSANGVESVVAEAKGGKKARFTELWKLLGLKTHLGIDRGVLLANPDDVDHSDKTTVGEANEIAVINQDATEFAAALRDHGFIDALPTDELLAGWERSYRVEDALIEVLRDQGLWKNFQTIRAAKQQLQEISSKVWLEPDPWLQARRLYDLYGELPKIGHTLASEMAPGSGRRLFNEALYEGKHLEVQACLYLEHRKRIMVAFAATRCALEAPRAAGWVAPTPASFNHMVDVIRQRQAWNLPTILQVYFLGFGGVIRTTHEDEEYGLIAGHVGCTADEAKGLLQLFDELFPYSNGWFYDARDLSRLKVMAAPLRGAGIRMRETVLGRPWEELASDEQRSYCGKECTTAADEIEGGYRLYKRRKVKRLIPRGVLKATARS
jgi:hypothetical protein